MKREWTQLQLLLYYRWKHSYIVYGIVFSLYLMLSLLCLLVKKDPVHQVRYEVYFASRSCLLLFLIALCILVAYGVVTLLYMQMNSHALQRYLILPDSRRAFMLSEFLMNASAIVMLLLLQYMVYTIGYRCYTMLAPLYSLKHGFYLSIVRSGMLKYLFPLTITQFLIIASSIVAISAMVVYLGVFYQRWSSYLLCLLTAGILVFAWGYPIGLQFSIQRGCQLFLVMLLAGSLALAFHKAMMRNCYGGR